MASEAAAPAGPGRSPATREPAWHTLGPLTDDNFSTNVKAVELAAGSTATSPAVVLSIVTAAEIRKAVPRRAATNAGHVQ